MVWSLSKAGGEDGGSGREVRIREFVRVSYQILKPVRPVNFFFSLFWCLDLICFRFVFILLNENSLSLMNSDVPERAGQMFSCRPVSFHYGP